MNRMAVAERTVSATSKLDKEKGHTGYPPICPLCVNCAEHRCVLIVELGRNELAVKTSDIGYRLVFGTFGLTSTRIRAVSET